MSKKAAIVIALIIISIVSLCVFIDKKFNVLEKLPAGVSIVNKYRASGFGNGDSSFGFKAVATELQYAEFCQKIGVPISNDKDRNAIGYFPITEDFPETERIWWDEPRSPNFKSFLREKRGFIRVSYSKGIIYYFSRTW